MIEEKDSFQTKGILFFSKECPTDYYKTIIGDETCQKCLYGKTNNTMHTQCGCKEDHYVGDDEDDPCYGTFLFLYISLG